MWPVEPHNRHSLGLLPGAACGLAGALRFCPACRAACAARHASASALAFFFAARAAVRRLHSAVSAAAARASLQQPSSP